MRSFFFCFEIISVIWPEIYKNGKLDRKYIHVHMTYCTQTEG